MDGNLRLYSRQTRDNMLQRLMFYFILFIFCFHTIPFWGFWLLQFKCLSRMKLDNSKCECVLWVCFLLLSFGSYFRTKFIFRLQKTNHLDYNYNSSSKKRKRWVKNVNNVRFVAWQPPTIVHNCDEWWRSANFSTTQNCMANIKPNEVAEAESNSISHRHFSLVGTREWDRKMKSERKTKRGEIKWVISCHVDSFHIIIAQTFVFRQWF